MTEIILKNIITPLQHLINMRNQLNNKLEYMNKYSCSYTNIQREYVIKYLQAYEKAIQDVK